MPSKSRSKAGKAKRSKKRPPQGSFRKKGTIVKQSALSQHEALSDRIIKERLEAFTKALRPSSGCLATDTPPDVRALHKVIQESYELFNSMLEELEPGLEPPLACKRGCIHCCYNQVALTEPEALFLGLHLLETRDAGQLKELTAKARAMTEKLKGKSWKDIGMARHTLPCLFMENGTCSIYPARPLVCRGWNSIDATMCLNSNQSGDAMTPIENHSILRLIAESIQGGLLQGAGALGLESGFLLMTRAVLLLLENEPEKGVMDSMDNWLHGRPFFAQRKNW